MSSVPPVIPHIFASILGLHLGGFGFMWLQPFVRSIVLVSGNNIAFPFPYFFLWIQSSSGDMGGLIAAVSRDIIIL
jgi:hypothetical protein